MVVYIDPFYFFLHVVYNYSANKRNRGAIHTKAFTGWISWATLTSWCNHIWSRWWNNYNQKLIQMMISHNQTQIQSPVQYPSQRMNIPSWITSAPQYPLSVHPATWKIVSNPPKTCPRCSKIHPTCLPRPSKVVNNTNSLEPATENCQKRVQEKVPWHTCPQPTQKSPLLPTSPAPARQQIRKTLNSGPPPCCNSQYHYKQHISEPYSAKDNKQCPAPLPNLPHLYTIRGRQTPVITEPHPQTQGQFSLQVPIYLPVLVLTLTGQLQRCRILGVDVDCRIPGKGATQVLPL